MLMDSGYEVIANCRSQKRLDKDLRPDRIWVQDITAETNWKDALQDVDCIVHLAAYAHDVKNRLGYDHYRQINTMATENLARAAGRCGVRRFIFLSSIKVNGETTDSPEGRTAFTEDDKANPKGPYAVSKWEAEQRLQTVADETDMDFVIIRPPMVYGPGVKANFHRMMQLIYRGLPMPFGAIHNKRSLVSVYNLIDLIRSCINHPNASNQIFMVGDGRDVSLPELLKSIGRYLDRPARLISVPVRLVEALLTATGKRELVPKLCGSLQIDIGKAQKLLGWNPVIRFEDALEKTVISFKESEK